MVAPRIQGLVFNIQRFCIHDGPGIRTTVFLKGCPLRCLWCDNPESQEPHPEIMLFAGSCAGCGACASVCPRNAIRTLAGKAVLDRSRCDACGDCVDACSHGALRLVGRYMTVGEVVDVVERDFPFYRTSGGGVTLSGGEPLAQPEFAEEVLRVSKHRGIHTAIETTGSRDWPAFERVLQFVDLVILDLKHMDPLRHQSLTGVQNGLIIENARRLAASGKPMLIRLAVVPGHNDSQEEIKAVAHLVSDLGGAISVEPLAYHQLGSGKYAALGREYKLNDVEPPGSERVQEIALAMGRAPR